MSSSRRLAEAAAQLLDGDERAAVLGDLEEAGESGGRALLDVLGLAMRRQTALWKSWRPWLAAFGLALPASFLLMGYSVAISQSWQRLIDSHGSHASSGLPLLISRVLLLAFGSWTAGFVVGSLSRRTLWVSIVASCLPCLFCLSRFREPSLPRLCLLLFLAPAIPGVWKGLRTARIALPWAVVLAIGLTALMILVSSANLWNLNWLLICPAWYMVATARKGFSI